ncbi:MAG TPA: hypothetical protein VHE60_00795 [Pyrinomonadaceae bacterium]|nr:hypothetical protein [Pyrinomonadaceae bacterium]
MKRIDSIRKSALMLFFAACFICAFAASSIFADGVKKKVRFARGTSSTTIRGGVIRGDRDRYYVGAKKGQTLSVKITSLEKNAVFQIYLSGEQESLPGAGDGDDAMKWSGELPADDEYVIVVGGTRGNASYTLTISIK